MPKAKLVTVCLGVLLLAVLMLASCSKKQSSQDATPDPSAAPAAPTASSAAAPAAAPNPITASGSSAADSPPASLAPAPAPSPGTQAPGVIQSQDANQPGLAADLIECKRGEGVLSVKVRFRNTSSKLTYLQVIRNRNFDSYYVTGGNKKYFILKDSEGTYLMPAADGGGMLNVPLEPGQAWTWWAKFPAPPAEVTKITLMMPITPPFEDVPITNK